MASFWIYQGNRYSEGRPFTFGDMNYTAAGATAATFQDLGFIEVQVQPRPDDRYYIVNSNPLDDGSWDAQPRDLDQLKESAISEAKTTAGSLLSQTDWMVTRQQETGQQVPGDVAIYRAGVREACNQYEAAIGLAKAIDELAGLEPGWPEREAQLEQ